MRRFLKARLSDDVGDGCLGNVRVRVSAGNVYGSEYASLCHPTGSHVHVHGVRRVNAGERAPFPHGYARGHDFL